VTPMVRIFFGSAAAAAATLLLPAPARPVAWVVVGATFSGFLFRAVTSMRSGLFGPARWRGPDGGGVALTYDDGPDPATTGALLDLLRERGVPAAFFVIGARVRAHPETVRRCRDEGHLLGNHSDRHGLLHNFFGFERMRREVAACQETLATVAGAPARHYRPPVGLMNPHTTRVARDLGLELVGWQVRSFDTAGLSAAAVARRVLARVRPGGIVLLHDGGLPADRVVETTRRILDGLATKGLAPVRLDRLLDGDEG